MILNVFCMHVRSLTSIGSLSPYHTDTAIPKYPINQKVPRWGEMFQHMIRHELTIYCLQTDYSSLNSLLMGEVLMVVSKQGPLYGYSS